MTIQGVATFDLVGIGNCAVDYVLSVESFPIIDGKCSSKDLSILGGGQGGNIVWAAARMGLNCALISKIGDDEHGDLIIKELKEVGVNLSWIVQESGSRTPITVIIADRSTGSRTCIHNKTGIKPLAPSEISFDLCRQTRLWVSDTRTPGISIQCADIARKNKAIVVVTLEHMNDDAFRLCSSADVVIASASLISQTQAYAQDEYIFRDFASQLGTNTLIVTLGDKGCILIHQGKTRRFPGHSVEVVDSIGAGDVFTASFCYGFLQGWPLEKICMFSNVVGAYSCKGKGARSKSIPSASDVNNILTNLEMTI